MNPNRIVAVCLAVITVGGAQSALGQTPLGTAFTYQGQLTNADNPATGLHDMRFQLFTAASGGTQVGATVCLDAVNVTDGMFTVSLDFGQQFDGNQRFLQVSVRADSTPANCASGTYTALTPRQPLTAAPYALKVPGVDGNSLNAADGSPVDALFVDNNGRVGIGTLAPTHSVHIANAQPTLALQDTDSTTQQVGYVSYRDSGNVERAWVGYGSAGDPDFSIINARAGGDIVLNAFGGGKVGIGTSSPAAPLHVLGAGQFENSGNQADLLWLASERSWVIRQEGTGATTALKFQSIGGGGNKNFLIDTTGFVGIGTLNPQAKLDVNGVARVQVLEIMGADIAEKFPASEALEPGMVVAIDAKNAGKLCLSRGAYNRCVAGVVSGANDFSVGAVLGNLPGHEDAPPIALSGRVYVRCDASNGAIEPGDLLTTSDTPGHAMKAADRDRSHGAVIGKAMERLEQGRGLVLVLVNLQ